MRLRLRFPRLQRDPNGNLAKRGLNNGTLAGGSTSTILTLNGTSASTRVVATVAWDRNITKGGGAAPADTYTVDATQGKFDILLNGPGGTQVISQATAGVTHLNFVVDQPGNYALQVRNAGNNPANAGQPFSVAYAVSAPMLRPPRRRILSSSPCVIRFTV